jgi:hypothetical protein
MSELVNLTPHPVTLVVDGAEVTVPASGRVARVATTEVEIGEVVVDGLRVPLVAQAYGDVENLPDPAPGVLYVVSALVAQAVPGRTDLVSPARLVRDDQGRVVGAGALCAPHQPVPDGRP